MATKDSSSEQRRSGSGLLDTGEPEPTIKVSDRRMFTADGRLREEYSHLADAPAPSPEAVPQPSPPRPEPAPHSAAGPAAAPGPAPYSTAPPSASAPSSAAGGPAPGRPSPADLEPPDLSRPGAPGFFDLVAMIAESAAVYLGDARLPDGSTAEDLELARLHIDLLDVLRRKTAGNLTQQESAGLDDVLYRLRVRYVQKRG